MLPDFSSCLRQMADVIVRVGLNLQPGQRLLVHDPYELHGVARSAGVIVEAVRAAARTCTEHEEPLDVIWGDAARLRDSVERRAWRALETSLTTHAARMQRAIAHGDALLFLTGTHPRLMAGLPAADVAQARQIAWECFGPIAQQLTGGATNWTCVPAPSPGWAAAAFEFFPAETRLTALWDATFAAFRCQRLSDPAQPTALERWSDHLRALSQRRETLNAERATGVRYLGAGTDLAVKLPPQHRWCTAQLTTRRGLPFVANLPTEEVFTAPDSHSATGVLRTARPLLYAGVAIEDIELEFSRGAVVCARAGRGESMLQQLLATDDGARGLGEVALVEPAPAWAAAAPTFQHVLFDENAAPHVALGEAYAFCHSGPSHALNRSLLHVDLPLAATATLIR